MYSIRTRQSATAIPVSIRLMGLVLMSLWVSTRILSRLNIVPTRETASDR